MTRCHHLALACALAAAGSCSPAPAEREAARDPAAAPSATSTALSGAEDKDCLLMVWSNQNDRNVEFDRQHDKVEGGAISCATGSTASQFDRAIVALRTAARTGDKARVLDQLGLPLTYIDAQGNRRELKDRASVDAAFDDVFDEAMIEKLSRLDLSEMAVAQGGGSFGLGALWLVIDEDGGQPRLVTVNRQALDEAAEAARAKAAHKQGQAVPFDQP